MFDLVLNEIRDVLHDHGGSNDELMNKIENIMQHRPNHFLELDNSYKRNKFLRNNYPFVEPKEIIVGTELGTRWKGNKKIIVEINETFAYVPLLDTIQQMLLNPIIAKELRGSRS